jgi:hypothetical protein
MHPSCLRRLALLLPQFFVGLRYANPTYLYSWRVSGFLRINDKHIPLNMNSLFATIRTNWFSLRNPQTGA